MNAPSSIASGCSFPQNKVSQAPRYDQRKTFRRKLRPGRPAKKQQRQYWLK